jgi:hypothetical protein
MAISRRDVLLGSAGALGQTDQVVMSEASTAKNGSFALAPGYS